MTTTAPGKRYAVIVGVDNYANAGISPLTCCANDAQAIKDALVKYCGFTESDIKIFTDNLPDKPKYTDILSAVEAMCIKATEEDLIFFFFAGHGTANENDSFLLTDDFRRNIIEDSSIPLKKLNEFYLKSSAKFKISIFDACQSGRFKERSNLPQKPRAEDLLHVGAEGWASMASCKQDEYAFEIRDLNNGLFTYFLVRGLAGEAANDKQYITLDELKNYTMSNVIDYANQIGQKQTPLFSGEQAGNLVMGRVDTTQDIEIQLTEDIKKIVEYDIQSIVPTEDKTDELINTLLSTIETVEARSKFVISNSDSRKNTIHSLIKLANEEMSLLKEDFDSSLGDKAIVSVRQSKLGRLPGQTFLSTRIYRSTIRKLVDFYIYMGTKEVVREDWARLPGITGMLRSSDSYKRIEKKETVEFPERIGSDSEAVILEIESLGRHMPSSALVFTPLPLKFGVYLMIYFISTEITDIDTEDFSDDTGITKVFLAIDPKSLTTHINSDIKAEFISFYTNSLLKRLKDIDTAFN